MEKRPVGRPKQSFKYNSPYSGDSVPIHIYKQEMRAIKRENLAAKTNNQKISGFTDNKIDVLVEIRDLVEALIKGELQKVKILNKGR